VDEQLFRIWIVECGPWRPAHWRDVPPASRAIELAEEQCLSTAAAAAYVQGFNEHMLATGRRVWAIAVPVRVVYQESAAIAR
jgi:hypothetical protein